MNTRRRLRRGMTLIEIVISTGIVVMIGAVGWSSVSSAIEMDEALQAGDNVSRSVRVSMSKLRRELQLAYLTPNRNLPDTYQTVFVGEGGDPSQLWFTSLSHQRLYRDSRESDQTELSLWVEDGPREVTKGGILYHREAERIDQYPDEGGAVYPLAYNVKEFGLRYLDSRTGEWVDEWDTRSADTPYVLPRAVQVGLVLLGTDPEDLDRSVDVPFVTTILLENADPVAPLLQDPGGQQ